MTDEASAKKLLSLHVDRLVALPDVVGAGVITPEDSPGTFAIALYVDAPQAPVGADQPPPALPDQVSAVVDGETIKAAVQIIHVGQITF